MVIVDRSCLSIHSAVTYNNVNTLVVGHDVYFEISFNHREAFLKGTSRRPP
jgi:hypothetical protein